METVEEKVIKIIQGKLPQSRKNISLEDRLFEDIDIDSLDCVEICMEIESEYGIKEFTIEGGLFNPSVQEIVNQVKNHLEKKPSGLEMIAKEMEILIEDRDATEYDDLEDMLSMLPYRACCLALTNEFKMKEHLNLLLNRKEEYTIQGRKKDLAKAGALIAAEIDRLNKLEEKK